MIASALWVLIGLVAALLVAGAAIETAITLYHTFAPLFRLAGSGA